MAKLEIKYEPMTGCWKNKNQELIYVQSCLSICDLDKYSRDIIKVIALNLRTGSPLELTASDFMNLEKLPKDETREIDFYMNASSSYPRKNVDKKRK